MLTAPPYTTNANPKNATYKIISCVASDMIVFVPFASTTGTIVQNTPIGVIKKNQAYAWNPTIAGTKCEDTTFLADNGVEIFTRTKAWPCTVIETEYGSCSVADILYIKNE